MSKAVKRKRGVAIEPSSRKTKVQKAARNGPIVRGDALKWKQVQLPDRLEDAEGFYGLEEIDDVELIKDASGQVTFRPKTVEDVIVGDGEVAGEEWEGFDEQDGEDKSENQHVTANIKSGEDGASVGDIPSTTKQSTKKGQTQKQKKASKSSPSQPIPITSKEAEVESGTGFDALEDSKEQNQADVTSWKELDLSHDVLSAISALGFSDPTPIQKAAIPPIRDGHDVIGKAATGSGKTLAFGIPIIERWLELAVDRTKDDPAIPTAFVLAPTRELAHQLSKHLTDLAKSLDHSPRIVTVTGGLAIVKQQRQLEFADIIIGTPGRLWEVINSSHGLIDKLKQIQFLVIDEADRLLSEGHFKEVEEILDVLDRKVIDETEGGNDEDDAVFTSKAVKTGQRQTLVFSATFHKGLQQKLATKQKWRPQESDLLSNTQSLDYLLRKLRFQPNTKPTFVDANPTSSMADKLSEAVLECGAMQKDLYIYSLLLHQQHEHNKQIQICASNGNVGFGKITRTLVFTNSISTVKRLVPLLSTLSIPNTTVLPLHSSMPQKSRLRSLERFTTPPSPTNTTVVLIATDVAARGLDIKGVDTIIHYHVPRTADMYVHRSGRTARASSSGRSILICSPDEVAGVTRLVSKVHSSQSPTQSTKPSIQPLYLPASLPTQLSKRVSLAQKITETTLSTTQVKSEESWLRNAAQELGVDYSSDEYEANSKRGRRGRGGGKDAKKKDAVEQSRVGNVSVWKDELRGEVKNRRVDFGDGLGVKGRGKFLAGGAVDVERLLKGGV